MDLPFELHIALRYLLAKRKQAFISVISLISTLGVTVGVMALVIALALMTGLQAELRDCAAKAAPQNLAAPHYAVHAAKLMNELARARDFGRLGARAFETDEIRA